MPQPIQILGDGVAGRCSAYLLSRAGLDVSMRSLTRPRLPAILLGEPAQKLISDIFELERAFEGLPRIRKRIVAWGANREPVTVEHSGIAISEEMLLERLGAPPDQRGEASHWTIHAAKPLPTGAEEHAFGSRTATAVPVTLRGDAEPEACWMESLPDGWLFLITTAPGAGWLLSVGADPAALLGSSQIAGRAIASTGAAAGRFPVAPRIASPLAGETWLACGAAAMAFDPICGDGTAHAVREGILAAAVIKAALRDGDRTALLAHYENRLTAGFLRHLLHAAEYYRTPAGDWWREESAALKSGIEWCGARLGGDPKFRYRLKGLDLEVC
jgi:hypothetical protein